MTKTQFRHDLRRGLGSCPLELERCADVEDYRGHAAGTAIWRSGTW